MQAQQPKPHEIETALEQGGLEAVEELHYPGEGARHRARIQSFPKPDGGGRDIWPEVSEIEEFPYRGDSCLGVRRRTHFFCDGIWVGYIEDVRGSWMFGSCFYRTHDGNEFAHWGGTTGAETYLMDRYWRYGDPPTPTLIQRFRRWMAEAELERPRQEAEARKRKEECQTHMNCL